MLRVSFFFSIERLIRELCYLKFHYCCVVLLFKEIDFFFFMCLIITFREGTRG